MQILHKTISFLHLSYDFDETLSFYIERIRDKNHKPQLTFWSFSYFFYFFPHPLYIFFNQIYKSNFWAVVPRHNVPSVPLLLPPCLHLLPKISLLLKLIFRFFIEDTQLYKRLCPSIPPSVSNDQVRKCENGHFHPCPPIQLVAVFLALFKVQINHLQKIFKMSPIWYLYL